MKKSLLAIAFMAALLLLTTSCAAKWEKFSFNGQQFQAGSLDNSLSIWVRDGYTPRLVEPEGAALDFGRLPAKTGAVVGICYLQTSGGKLADQSGTQPLANEQITIMSQEYGVSITRSDAAGLFIETLFPGNYQFYCRGAGVDVKVRAGKTVLVPLRGAKRMVD